MNNSDAFLSSRTNSILQNDVKQKFTKKKLSLNQNHHEVSKDFLDLGYLHKIGRQINYIPQDTKAEFQGRIHVLPDVGSKVNNRLLKSKGFEMQHSSPAVDSRI